MKYMTKTETNTETDKNQENNTENINEIENENENCPICYENFSGKNKDCVKNHNIESNCKHYFCTKCLTKMAFCNIIDCPICRDDISELIEIYSNKIDEYCICGCGKSIFMSYSADESR